MVQVIVDFLINLFIAYLLGVSLYSNSALSMSSHRLLVDVHYSKSVNKLPSSVP
jgi:hypothetical protein